MICNGKLELYYLDDRDYVNGLTLFEESMRSICGFLNVNPLPPLVVQQFKMMKFIRTHAHLELYHLNDIAQRSRLRYASALLDLAIDEVEYRALLFPEDAKTGPVTVQSYDRSGYVKEAEHHNDGTSRAIIHNVRNSYELLRGVIEVNQRFTVKHAPRMGIPASRFWGYMTGYRFTDPQSIPKEIEVDFHLKQVMPQKDSSMIVRAVDMPTLADMTEFELCFFGPKDQ